MAMSKKNLLAGAFIMVLLVSILVGIQSANVAMANPSWGPNMVPVIMISSPASNAVYTANNVPLTFTVSVPKNITYNGYPWNVPYEGEYSIDGVVMGQIRGLNSTTNSFDVVRVNLTEVSEGSHRIEVTASMTYPMGIAKGDEVCYFTVASSLPSPSPSVSPSPSPTASPTLSPTIEPTLEPTSTPQQPTGFLGTSLSVEYGYAIVVVLVIIVVAGLSLVYWKRLRK
jgi:hypothetical protein